MQIEPIVVGAFQVNCYLVVDGDKALVIDPGADADDIVSAVVPSVSIQAILLTHAHLDHIGAVKQLAKAWDVPVYLHSGDLPLYHSPQNAMPDLYPYEEKPEPETTIENLPMPFNMHVLHTPGHSPGGCCFYFPDRNVAFTGDTLFCGSVGRDDLPGGDFAQMIRSIKTQLMTLPDDVTLYPGHGPSTTVLQERTSNPFLT